MPHQGFNHMPPTSEEKANIREFGARLEGIDYIDRPGVYAVIENDHEQIAVIETNNNYFLPGGGVESGETDMEALRREILEEIGYQVLAAAQIGETIEYIEAYTDGKYYRVLGRFYRVQIGAKIGQGVEKDHRLVWLRQKDALKLLLRKSQVWAVHSMSKT